MPNNVINEVDNSSNHNFILLSFAFINNLTQKVKCDTFNCNYLWKLVSNNNIPDSKFTFNTYLSVTYISTDLLLCTNCNYLKYNINMLLI